MLNQVIACPHCGDPGPFSQVSIQYSDGFRRFRCGSCSRYFKESDVLPVALEEAWHRHSNEAVSRFLRDYRYPIKRGYRR